jgi:hypothetical protein
MCEPASSFTKLSPTRMGGTVMLPSAQPPSSVESSAQTRMKINGWDYV